MKSLKIKSIIKYTANEINRSAGVIIDVDLKELNF